jgi:hypothetical protein
MLDWQCKLKQHCPFLILGEPSFFFLGQHFLLGPGFAGETDISCSLSTSAFLRGDVCDYSPLEIMDLGEFACPLTVIIILLLKFLLGQLGVTILFWTKHSNWPLGY